MRIRTSSEVDLIAIGTCGSRSLHRHGGDGRCEGERGLLETQLVHESPAISSSIHTFVQLTRRRFGKVLSSPHARGR